MYCDPQKNRIDETVLMMGDKIGFYGEILLIVPKLFPFPPSHLKHCSNGYSFRFL